MATDKERAARARENAKTLKYIKAEKVKADKASRRAVRAGSKVRDKKANNGFDQDSYNTL